MRHALASRETNMTKRERGTGRRLPDRRSDQRRHRTPDAAREPAAGEGFVPKRSGAPILYGMHTVIEALRNPQRRFGALFVTENALQRLGEAMPNLPVTPTLVRPDAFARLVRADAVHQGIALEALALPAMDLHELPGDGVVVVLDQVTDPHNVGAVLRSAAAFGATGLIMTERHSPEAGGLIAKAASGALEHVPLITVGNLSQALMALGERGFWRIGLDSEGDVSLPQALNRPPLALVLGAEGKGLRRLTRERCDVLARLDMPGAIKSLNVSNAAAVALYALHAGIASA
jgi:23S rRNA (guanosine2251-2'-O)-methyltransferase